MPSLQGVKFRLGWIREALTRRFEDLVVHPVAPLSFIDMLKPLLADLPFPPPELLSAAVPGASAGGVVESSEPEVARTLYALARLLNARCVAEVGVFRGYTSQFLAAAVAPQNGALHLVDASPDALSAAEQACRPYRGGLVVSHVGFSTDRRIVSAVPDDCDLIYLDADHSEAGVDAELAAWLPKVRPGGLLAVHDSIGIRGVCRAVNRRARACPALTMATSRGSGLTIFQPSARP